MLIRGDPNIEFEFISFLLYNITVLFKMFLAI